MFGNWYTYLHVNFYLVVAALALIIFLVFTMLKMKDDIKMIIAMLLNMKDDIKKIQQEKKVY